MVNIFVNGGWYRSLPTTVGSYLHTSRWVALNLVVAIVDGYISTSYAVLTGYICMKMSGSELRGQEEAACMCILGLRGHYSELFMQMSALHF